MNFKHNPPVLSELMSMKTPPKFSRKVAKVSFSRLEKFALLVTRGVGTMGFFFVLSGWTVVWLLWNLYAPVGWRFDPAPAFVIWLFSSNIIQLILLPLIMVGQNLEGKFAEHRAQADYEINQKAQREVEVVIAHLENQNELLLEILRKIERS